MFQVRYVQPAEEEVCDTKGGEEGQVAMMIINIMMAMMRRMKMMMMNDEEDLVDEEDEEEKKSDKQVTSLVANEGLIVCGLCNGTANVYSQVHYKDLIAMSDLENKIYSCFSEWCKAGASAGLPELRWSGTGEQQFWVNTGTGQVQVCTKSMCTQVHIRYR